MDHDTQAALPAFRDGTSEPFLEPGTGLPALANLSYEAGIAYVAGQLARLAIGGDFVDLFVGIHPAMGHPTWARIRSLNGGRGAEMRLFDGHPDDRQFLSAGAIVAGLLATTDGEIRPVKSLLQAASFVYDLVVREAMSM